MSQKPQLMNVLLKVRTLGTITLPRFTKSEGIFTSYHDMARDSGIELHIPQLSLLNYRKYGTLYKTIGGSEFEVIEYSILPGSQVSLNDYGAIINKYDYYALGAFGVIFTALQLHKTLEVGSRYCAHDRFRTAMSPVMGGELVSALLHIQSQKTPEGRIVLYPPKLITMQFQTRNQLISGDVKCLFFKKVK